MNKFVSLDKRSKKAQKEYYSRHRCTWGELNPVTKSVPSGKTYNRKKDKNRIGKEFRDGFDADSFFADFQLKNLLNHINNIYIILLGGL
ncbi:MAG: hypothetical protein K6E85_12660 [Lachnospiraceae bacterium]|nr:hypothetical protein [Lachnospiraceae bacterium]